MHHISSLGIVHLDLAARNVLLSRAPDDDYEVAKIADFGLAIFTDKEREERQDEGPSED